VEEFDALEPHMTNKIKLVRELSHLKREYNCSLWGEVVKTNTAAALALFCQDYYGGAPCLTENQYRQGKAYYLATQPEPEFYRDFLKYLCRLNRVPATLEAPAGVEVTKRKGKDAEYLFILNHNPHAVAVNISGKYRDLIGDQEYEGSVSLNSKASMVLKGV
jgi:beta-galactosidase